MAQLFSIEDNTVVVTNLSISKTQGSVKHTGDYGFTGNVDVAGAVSADSFNIKNLNVDGSSSVSIPNLILSNTQGSATHTGSYTFNSGVLIHDVLNVQGTLTASTIAVQNIVANNGLSLLKLTLGNTSGNVTHNGDYNISGNVTTGNITTSSLTADTINVKNLVTDNGPLSNVGSWVVSAESEVNGKGFNWNWETGQAQLIYRTGGRLWTNANVDIDSKASYNINNIPVLSAGALGPSITSSNLTTIGELRKLSVSGDTTLSDFAFFNSTVGRLGIGTAEPDSAITILENGVSINIGSPSVGLAVFGTNSNHDVAIMSDGVPRITVKNNGTVNIGDPANQSAVLNVYGTLNVTKVVTDNRIEKSNSIDFIAGNLYGVGLTWSGNGSFKKLTLMNSPDRFLSSEHIDIGNEKSYYIDGQLALSSSSIGPGVIYSNLTTVGTLQNLTVQGDTSLSNLTANNIAFGNGISINASGVNLNGNVISTNDNSIQIGDLANIRKPVKVFGPLSVNINNPDPTLSFSVGGDVSIGEKRFTNSTSAPTTGTYQLGDICWNTNPIAHNYIGWVCVQSGIPGQWLGFGMIGSQ